MGSPPKPPAAPRGWPYRLIGPHTPDYVLDLHVRDWLLGWAPELARMKACRDPLVLARIVQLRADGRLAGPRYGWSRVDQDFAGLLDERERAGVRQAYAEVGAPLRDRKRGLTWSSPS